MPSAERRWATDPLSAVLPRLILKRGYTTASFAREVGVDPSHLSRISRGADGKRPSQQLLERIAHTLDLPAEYFAEHRRAKVAQALDKNQALTDQLFESLRAPNWPGPR